MPARKSVDWTEAAWVLAMAAQGGLMVAFPVLAGLALGFWLDTRFGTLPWISLVLTLIGGTVGPIMLYRWVTSAVKQRMEQKQDEEKPEQ